MKYQSINKDNQDKRLQLFVNNRDYEALMAEYEALGYGSVSAFLRKKIIGRGVIIPNARELKDKLDKIGYQYASIGNNINQIAKKVHLYHKEGRFPDGAMNKFNEVMEKYIKVTDDLSRAHRAFLRQLSR